MLGADLVDEAALLRSSKVVGPDGIDALEGLSLAALTGSPRLELIRTEIVGPDTIDVLARR
jgi:riboflavin biosynthesis pyrimidine reductase